MAVPFSRKSIATNLGKPNAGYSMVKNLIEIDELIDENVRGICILKVYQAYIGSSKSISLSVEEILVREVERK